MSAARSPRLGASAAVLLGAGVALAAVAGALYAFGTQHTPDYTTSLFGQTGPDTFKLKSWLATGVLAFAAVQLGLALWMYGRLPWIGVAPPSVGPVHRAIGALVAKIVLVQSPRWRVPGWGAARGRRNPRRSGRRPLVHECSLVLQRLPTSLILSWMFRRRFPSNAAI